MKIYTKTGDQGDTGLFGGGRVSKNAPRIWAYGTVDQLNALLGVARAAGPADEIDVSLGLIQHDLFQLGAELATPEPASHGISQIGDEQIARLEGEIDRYEATLPPLKQFILPAGTPAAAQLHYARTVCREAERYVVALCGDEAEQVSIQTVVYLNRLSDLLFVLARAANLSAGRAETPWESP